MRFPKLKSELASCLVLALLASAGCRLDMHVAPRHDPLERSEMFADRSSARPLIEGTVARGHLDDDEHYFTGRVGGELATELPVAIDEELLRRGQERYNIFCAPCHGATGAGDGMIVRRGYRAPSSLHEPRLREASVGHFFDVMTQGFGAMPTYAPLVPAHDRWAIAAYIRALQLSQDARIDAVPDQDRQQLQRQPDRQQNLPPGSAATGPGR
jgi:mono/diheme cytochrome c family protein